MAALDTFIALRDYVKGKIDSYDLKESDDSIYKVINHPTRGQSEIIISFDNEEEFLKSLGLSDDDTWFYRVLNGPYSEYEFVDSYYVKEEFEEGWGPSYFFDKENEEKLADISRAILPMKINFNNEDYRSKLSEKLLTNFTKETQNILDDYQTERNYEMTMVARETMDKELKEFLNSLGFDLYTDGFSTTVGNLIYIYIKDGSLQLTLTELLKKLTEDSPIIGGWYESQFEYRNDEKFDKKSFNSYTSNMLDKILEKIENSEGGVTIQDYTEMIERITKKFKQDKYYDLPKDPKKETRFKIEGFLYPEMKIVVTLSKEFKQRKVKLSEDNFYNLLYQPTLFNLDEI